MVTVWPALHHWFDYTSSCFLVHCCCCWCDVARCAVMLPVVPWTCNGALLPCLYTYDGIHATIFKGYASQVSNIFLQEFISFLLPLLNLYPLKNLMIRKVMNRNLVPTSPNARTLDDFAACGLCGETPTQAHEIGCRHVFCYYCVAVSFLSLPLFSAQDGMTRGGNNKCTLCDRSQTRSLLMNN